MKWIVCLLSLGACQRGDRDHAAPPASAPIGVKSPMTADYRQDITTLCDVVHLSKADEAPENERWPLIAMWLGPHLKTPEAHDFLVSIQPLAGEPKAAALEAEARRSGLTGCALAAEWRR